MILEFDRNVTETIPFHHRSGGGWRNDEAKPMDKAKPIAGISALFPWVL